MTWHRLFRLVLHGGLLLACFGVSGASLGAEESRAPLADAVQRGDRAAVRSLLRDQVDINAAQGNGATALHWAVYLDDTETTALLLRAGADSLRARRQERRRGHHRPVTGGRCGSQQSRACRERR